MLSLSVHKNIDYSAPILFVPTYVKTTDKPFITQTSVKPIATQKNISPNEKKVAPAPKTTVAINKTSKPTTVAVAVPQKTNIKQTEPKTTSFDTLRTNGEEKIKSSQAEPQKIAKLAPKKEDVKAKIEEKKPQEKINTPITQALDITQTVVPTVPSNAHISDNYREVEALRKHAQLQKEIIEKWKPPIGVSPECTCDVSFFVNNKGMLEHIKMIKNSGVMMFDISARQALCAIKMPQWTYGKTLTINFRQ
jgi:hypothetical protein